MNTQTFMIDKNAFEEKELWASFLNFSNKSFFSVFYKRPTYSNRRY